MSVRSGQSIVKEFTTCTSAGALTNADSLPTGTLVVAGVDNAATVTITNISTGRYKFSVTLPTLTLGQVVDLFIAATIGGVSAGKVVWSDSFDFNIDSNGRLDLGEVIGSAVTGSGGTVDASLVAAGLDRVLVESGITPSASLVDDGNTQLAAINARQALSLAIAALAAVLAGGGTSNNTIQPAGNPSGNIRISATVNPANGSRTAVSLKVPV